MTPKINRIQYAPNWLGLEFSGPEEALDLARILCTGSQVQSGCNSHHEESDASWYGSKSYPEADKLALEGWPQGLAKADNLKTSLCGVLGARNVHLTVETAPSGFAVCVPAMLAGSPDAMFQIQETESNAMGKIVHVVYNQTVSAGIDAKTIELRGAIALALIDTLESSGFRCQVTVATNTKYHDKNHTVFIDLKQPEDPLNLDTLAFWIIHPSAYRRMMFSLWEHAFTDLPGGYGMPGEMPVEKRGDIYLNEACLTRVDDKTAIPFLKEQLAKYGVTFDS